MIKITDLYDLNETYPEVKAYLQGFTYPWEALEGIKELVLTIGTGLSSAEYDHPEETVWISKTAKVFPSAYIGPNTIIGPETEVRHCAFIRGSAIIGAGSVIGNSTEIKNAILFNKVQVPHYNYVGDSILGFRSHMGAGSITSNVKSDKKNVVIHGEEEQIGTGLKKVGAMLGDFVEVGCGSVLNPGTVIGKNSNVYPLSSVRGVVPADSIFKERGKIVKKED